MKPTSEIRDIEDVRRDVGSIESVLERHGFDSSPRRLVCPNPDHDDRKPGSVSVLPSRGGQVERIYCHACGLNEDAIGLARKLGEFIEFTRPVDEKQPLRRRIDWHKPIPRKQRIRMTRLTGELEDDPTIVKDWIVAKKLAELGNRAAVQKAILSDWDHLTAAFNIPRVWELVQGIWLYGAEHFGLPSLPSTEQGWKRWVEKVARELERV